MRNTVAHTPLACENIQMIAGINMRNRPELRDAEHEHDGGQQPRMRNAGHKESESDERGLHERRHDHAERHALHRLPGENHRRIAALSREPARECTHAGRRSLALCIENGRDDHREQEVPEQAAEAAGDRQQPGGHGFHVRVESFRRIVPAHRRTSSCHSAVRRSPANGTLCEPRSAAGPGRS